MAQLYTPWMAKAGQQIRQARQDENIQVQQAQQNKLIQSAYMGDPQAMEGLMQVNPEMGMKIQEDARKRKDKTAQTNLSQRATFTKETKDIMSNIAQFDTFEEARNYGNMMTQDIASRYPEIIKSIGVDAVFDEDDFNQAKQIYGDESSQGTKGKIGSISLKDFTIESVGKYEQSGNIGDLVRYSTDKTSDGQGAAFAGMGMPAQVSSALVRGVNEPEFRNTPDYARSWDIANKPTIIDTEDGRIPLYPIISPMFKPPGVKPPVDKETEDDPIIPSVEPRTESQEISEISEIQKVAKRDSKIIEGTQKTKTTADEKLSVGYYNRMVKSEANIKALGKFDSASIWEQFRGLTNITASSELQQYRQAADDWIRSKLRRESGAVIAPMEMAKEYEIYYPRIGDSQKVIDQKTDARKTAAQSMKIAAGRFFKEKGTDEPVITKKVEVPEVGFVSKGYVFMGGDPSDKASWRKQ